jgi:hypothetical protein
MRVILLDIHQLLFLYRNAKTTFVACYSDIVDEAHEHAMHLHIKITIYVKKSIILFCYHPDRNEQSKIQMEL